METIHYIGKEWNHIWIIAKSICGMDQQNCKDSSSDAKYVTCKRCLKIFNNN